MIRVFVVEDSPTVREFLIHVLNSDPGIRVIGTAANGNDAVQAVLAAEPDAITMDLHLPGIDGLEATRRIMRTRPTPIIVVSANVPAGEATDTFDVLRAGALAIIRRPTGLDKDQRDRTAKELIRMVKIMSEVKLVRRWPEAQASKPGNITPDINRDGVQLVVIGGSTGAPAVLESILQRLPKQFPWPVAIVQHIATGFVEGFAHWLSQACSIPVSVARHGMPLLPGHAYVAPDQFHLAVDARRCAVLAADPPEHGVRPAISYLFRSVAGCFEERAAGVLLTGMGSDGAEALKLMRNRGALTIVQSPETAVVDSMPREAVRREAAECILAPHRIGAMLSEMAIGTRRHETPRDTLSAD